MFNKKFIFLIFVLALPIYLIVNTYLKNKKDSEYYTSQTPFSIEKQSKEKLLEETKRIASSSAVFLINFAVEDLEKKIRLDMENKKIEAIVIKDFFLHDNFLVAYRDENENISFTKELPEEFKDYSFIKEKIIEEKSYTTTNIGELILYYKDISAFASPTFTKEESIYLIGKKEIKLCINPNAYPLDEITSNNEHIGMAADYIKIIEKEINKKITLVPTKIWAESLENVKNGKCDILSLTQRTSKRESYLYFTQAYITSNILIATKIGVPFIDDIKSIQNKRLAIVKDYFLYETLKKEYPNINLIQVDSLDEGLKEVEKGQIFGYIDSSIILNHIIQEDFLGTITISGKLKNKMNLSIAVNNKEKLLVSILNKILLSIDEDTKQFIFNKWIKITHSEKTDYTLVWQLTLISIFVILITLYWNRKLTIVNRQLEFQRNKAHEASKVKAQFLANMSHEIRTPMNAIIGMSHLLLQSPLNKNQKEHLEKIDKSANSLLRVINDILDFSKMEAGKLSFEIKEFNLKDIINDSIGYISLPLKEKGLKFSLNYDQNLNSNYLGDKLRVTQILTNLLSNAVKFTEKGSITLTVKKLEYDYIRFEVKDTGIGLSILERKKLFKSFCQADVTTSKKYGGTGLGLAICKQLVQMMDGDIWINSAKGVGSSFIFEIKLLPVMKSSLDNINKTAQDFSNNYILLVEDNKVNQQIITGLLRKTKIKIDIAQNGQEAINLFKSAESSKYELILMDIQMPILDGYDTTKELRKIGINIPIIALSANVLTDESKESGMNEHLKKPLKMEELIDVFEKYLKKSSNEFQI